MTKKQKTRTRGYSEVRKEEMDYDEEHDAEEEDEEFEQMAYKEMKELVEKSILASEKVVKENRSLAKKNDELQGKIAQLQKKLRTVRKLESHGDTGNHVPPEDDAEQESDVDHDTTENEVADVHSDMASTAPAENTAEDGGRYTGKSTKGADMDEKTIEAMVKKHLETVKVPNPFGFSEATMEIARQPWEAVRKAIEVDRETVGGGNGRTGISQGVGNDRARGEVLKYLNKSFSKEW